MDKATSRLRMRQVRRRLRLDQPGAAAAAAHAFARSAFAAAFAEAAFGRGVHSPGAVAAVYNAQGSELDAGPLAAVLRGLGVVVVLPAASAAGAPLAFRQARDGDLFAADASGVPAPAPNVPVRRPGLVFTPLLAFDRRGGRLGQGGGYYDHTLAALRAQGPPVVALGLAYAGQEVELAPMDAHDARLDGVLTEAGLTLFADLAVMVQA